MYKYLRMIQLRDTDATGVLYFADQFKIALEALEFFLKERGFPLKTIIEKENFLLPIVHAEADYSAPLSVGDEIEITLSLGPVGTSSFTLNYDLFNIQKKEKAGKVSIVHVTISKETKKGVPIPPVLKKILMGKGH
jgi:1,4-dihydroxy-2-naphthoyl-CoA hydrolase